MKPFFTDRGINSETILFSENGEVICGHKKIAETQIVFFAYAVITKYAAV